MSDVAFEEISHACTTEVIRTVPAPGIQHASSRVSANGERRMLGFVEEVRMPLDSSSESQVELIRYLRGGIERGTEMHAMDAPIVGDYGFCVSSNNTLCLIRADIGETGWFLKFYGGVALDVPDPPSAFAWANGKNVGLNIGKYVCQIPDSAPARCNVVYTESLFGELIDPGFKPIVGWLGSLVQVTLAGAASEMPTFIDAHGGRPFTEADVPALVMISLS